MVFFNIDMGLTLFLFLVFHAICHQLIAACFVVDLLRRVVMLSTISFFIVFTLAIQMVNFDPTESLDQIMFVSMLQIWNLRYFRQCWIIKCVGLKLILFAINMDVASSSKVFCFLDSMFLSITFLIRINKFIYFQKKKI